MFADGLSKGSGAAPVVDCQRSVARGRGTVERVDEAIEGLVYAQSVKIAATSVGYGIVGIRIRIIGCFVVGRRDFRDPDDRVLRA